jgi:hypothetical protein
MDIFGEKKFHDGGYLDDVPPAETFDKRYIHFFLSPKV